MYILYTDVREDTTSQCILQLERFQKKGFQADYLRLDPFLSPSSFGTHRWISVIERYLDYWNDSLSYRQAMLYYYTLSKNVVKKSVLLRR